MILQNCRVVLASASSRRRELLSEITETFEILPAEGSEDLPETHPDLLVQLLSEKKAVEVFGRLSADHPVPGKSLLVIGADTVVFTEGRILGKPADEEDAFRMLRMLSGRTHSVYTGVTLITAERKKTFYERTDVTCYEISDADIRSYIATGSPMDKAGAYGIQDSFAKHVRCISGDYYSVVGFPLGRVYEELKTF